MLIDVLFVVIIVALLIALYKIKFSNSSSSVLQYDKKQPKIATEDINHIRQTQNIQEQEESQIEQNNIINRRKQLHKQQKLREKKQRKEAMEHYLQGQKLRRQKQQKEQNKKDEQKQQMQQKQAEIVAQLHEQQRKKKQQEFNKWKNMFIIEDEGKEELEDTKKRQKQQLHQKILSTLRKNKLCLLQDLSQEYKVSTKQLVELLRQFELEGRVSGIFDQRGKYLVIEEGQWQSIKRFINAKGRVKKIQIMSQCSKIIEIPENLEASDEQLFNNIDQNP